MQLAKGHLGQEVFLGLVDKGQRRSIQEKTQERVSDFNSSGREEKASDLEGMKEELDEWGKMGEIRGGGVHQVEEKYGGDAVVRMLRPSFYIFNVSLHCLNEEQEGKLTLEL